MTYESSQEKVRGTTEKCSEMLDWCPEEGGGRRGVVGRLRMVYNALGRGFCVPLLWSVLSVSLAGALVFSALESARAAGSLNEQIDRLEDQIEKARLKNDALKEEAQPHG